MKMMRTKRTNLISDQVVSTNGSY